MATNCLEAGILSSEQAAWLAGFIDGEGYFKIRRDKRNGKYELRLAVTNTDLPSLEYCQMLAGGKIYTMAKHKESDKKAWQWFLSSKVAKALAQKLYPYFITKSRAVSIILNFPTRGSSTMGQSYRLHPLHLILQDECWRAITKVHQGVIPYGN